MGRRLTTQELAVLDERRAKVAECYLAGWRQIDIAEELGVDQATISRDIKALRVRWQREAIRDINKAKGQELAKIDRLEREYWRAWEESKEKRTITSSRMTGTPDELKNQRPMKAEATKREEERLGDPRYLEGVRWCIQRRCEILGIDAPKKQEHSGLDGGPILVSWDDRERDA